MDAAAPLVSVIMSVHNGEQWLNEAIESIIRQTYTHWEFIIVDDASNKATQDLLNHYRIDSRIKIIRVDSKQGLTKNLNTAIHLCNGEFIARMDADDISMHDRLEKQVAWLQVNPHVSVIASFIDIMDEKGKVVSVWPDDRKAITWQQIRVMLPWKNCIAHPSVMIRKKVLEQYRYNESQVHSQDWDLWLRLAAEGKIIEKIAIPLLLYRIHPASITSTSNRRSVFSKQHEFYQRYLKHSAFSRFNTKVRLGFIFNSIKLFLSRIKRKFIS
ncbi:MAG TPA: glycosyltransferase [Chitinophagaceae bacterium]